METNKQKLINAIQQLPSFEPTDKMWEGIELELDNIKQAEWNKTALDKACLQLPDQELEVNLWMRIEQSLQEETTEKNKTHLDQAILELPSPSLDDEGLWAKIEEDLENNNYEEINRNRLQEAITDLPDTTDMKDELVWSQIETEIKQETKGRQITFNFRRMMAVAASILVCLVATWSILQIGHQQSHINTTEVAVNFSEEEVELTEEVETNVVTHTEEYEKANDFIQSYCSSLPPECRSSEFTTLQEELYKIEEEYQKLKQVYQDNKDNLEVFSYIVRLEKQKNQLTKTLIQLIVT